MLNGRDEGWINYKGTGAGVYAASHVLHDVRSGIAFDVSTVTLWCDWNNRRK